MPQGFHADLHLITENSVLLIMSGRLLQSMISWGLSQILHFNSYNLRIDEVKSFELQNNIALII